MSAERNPFSFVLHKDIESIEVTFLSDDSTDIVDRISKMPEDKAKALGNIKLIDLVTKRELHFERLDYLYDKSPEDFKEIFCENSIRFHNTGIANINRTIKLFQDDIVAFKFFTSNDTAIFLERNGLAIQPIIDLYNKDLFRLTYLLSDDLIHIDKLSLINYIDGALGIDSQRVTFVEKLKNERSLTSGWEK